jgi:adenosine deaminase
MAIRLVDPSGEVDAITQIGVSLREEVARRGLAIEINPTSNLLIGDLSDLENHPLWRLAPPRPRPDLPPLAITVGSDDPLVFNCRLPGEYQLLFDALLLAGLTDLEAMAWLDRVRRNGLERRFTVPLAAAAPAVVEPFNVQNSSTLDPPLLT